MEERQYDLDHTVAILAKPTAICAHAGIEHSRAGKSSRGQIIELDAVAPPLGIPIPDLCADQNRAEPWRARIQQMPAETTSYVGPVMTYVDCSALPIIF